MKDELIERNKSKRCNRNLKSLPQVTSARITTAQIKRQAISLCPLLWPKTFVRIVGTLWLPVYCWSWVFLKTNQQENTFSPCVSLLDDLANGVKQWILWFLCKDFLNSYYELWCYLHIYQATKFHILQNTHHVIYSTFSRHMCDNNGYQVSFTGDKHGCLSDRFFHIL